MEIQAVKQRFSIIGNSPKLNQAIYKAIQVAPTDISVLIEGESGVGKEVFSKIIHQLSRRKHEKFIAVNCGAIPEGTINSELFGHEKGAFTGASDKRSGYFETVNNGTIFLDEIGEMPLETQAFLLRVLESGEFIKVGSSKVQKTDVRIIAATNVNLMEKIAQGKFREDLYYRLATVTLSIPALRQRKEDIPLLFRKFAADFAEKYSTTPVQLDPQAQEFLRKHNWQGNIRQLKNTAEQISVLSPQKVLQGEEVLSYLPQNTFKSLLPVLVNNSNQEGQNLNERDLIYKFLYEIKKDVNELKKVVGGIIQQSDIQQFQEKERSRFEDLYNDLETKITQIKQPEKNYFGEVNPFLNENNYSNSHPDIEDVEENLSIEEMEKRMIIKALKKHNGKRKDASIQLGISERTLYRKIKQYDLEE